MRVLRGVVYMTKSSGPRTEPGVEVTVKKRHKPGIFSNVNKQTNHLMHNK